MGMEAIVINERRHYVQIFNPPLTEGSWWNLRENGLGVSEEKLFKGIDGRTMDDGRTDDGQGVITIANPEPSSQAS